MYLDDIIVFSRTFDEHMVHLSHVLGLPKAANVSLKLTKCRFAQRELLYLGYLIKLGRLEMLDARVNAAETDGADQKKEGSEEFLGTDSVLQALCQALCEYCQATVRPFQR